MKKKKAQKLRKSNPQPKVSTAKPDISNVIADAPVIENKKESKISKFLMMPLRAVGKWLWRRKWWVLIALVALLSVLYFFGGSGKKTDNQFITIPITRGSLRQVVTATGDIQPVNTIKVGSQVSGIIEQIFVDYNDKVTKGQLLLKIDPSVLQATADEAKAALDSAIAQLNFDKAEYNRSRTLFESGFIARAEMEQAKTRFDTSEQTVKRMQSQYDRAMTNLGYATITSPVDGTVISRKVDKGQTVAASFQAPDLFEIAEDLSKMQIQTSVSEADIGMIKTGQEVTFTVDAYPTQTFKGGVQQIRLSPTTTQNVVVYTVIIDVDNGDLRLMPGMTAFVTIVVEEKENVWKAANAAFLVRDLKSLSDDPCIQGGDCTPRNTLLVQSGDKKPEVRLVPFKKGLTTATETEIIATDDAKQLSAGDRVVTGRVGAATGNAAQVGGQFGSRSGMNSGASGGGGNRPMGR